MGSSRVVRSVLLPACAVLLGAGAVALPAGAATAAPTAGAPTAGGWLRPVDGPVVRPFEEPAGPYGAGHRGADLAVPPGTPVRAAGNGVVTFAGEIAGTWHVTVLHDDGLRTSYSFLTEVTVRAGRTVSRGDVLGVTGGVDPDGSAHDGSVLHLGLRVGDRYVDPMVLFGPVDLAKVVHLAPPDDPAEGSWSPAAERRSLAGALGLAVPGTRAQATTTRAQGDGESVDPCGGGVPLPAAALDAMCDIGGDIGGWVGDHVADAVDDGLSGLHALTGLAGAALESLRSPAVRVLSTMRDVAAGAAGILARTPAGRVALDLVEMGRRFVDGVTAECSTDAPDANGTGGSAHRVMVVAGINSAGPAGDRGPTVDLDVAALGYHADEGEVRWFSYAAGGGAYTEEDTYGSIAVAARRLRAQLRTMQREQPGREVDLLAHSQGGVVVDFFLTHLYHAADPTLPPLGNVVTLSSPHQGAPLATSAVAMHDSVVGGRVLEAAEAVLPVPPGDSAALRDLAEDSPVMQHLWDHGLPDHVDFTTIGAPEDLVVPADRISVPGATETVQAVNSPSEHSAIVTDPNALRAMRAALEHRAPPCVGIDTALRSAVAPVVISRTEQTIGESLSGGLEVKTG